MIRIHHKRFPKLAKRKKKNKLVQKIHKKMIHWLIFLKYTHLIQIQFIFFFLKKNIQWFFCFFQMIELMYFLDKMLPPDSQQLIRWRKKKDTKATLQNAPRVCKTSAEDEDEESDSDYIKLLSKQVID